MSHEAYELKAQLRDRTGKGAYIQLPMLDALAYFNFPDMFQHRTFENDTTGAVVMIQ